MIRLNDITSKILSYHPSADIGLIEKAYVYSAKVHKKQTRLSGEPYLSHPLEVAGILTNMKMDEVSVTSGLLHDTVEDTLAELTDIEYLFGKEVATIVDGVTKISKIQFLSKEKQQAENIRKMILAMATDIRVLLVKLADRLHNMQTLGFQPPEKQDVITRETLDIYAPLAGRMGIYWLKSTLEDLSLFYLEPKIYEDIRLGIAQRREAQEKFIREIKEILSKTLREANIKATIKGRHKHFFSIYQKMMEQDLNTDQVYDVMAFRIIVNSVKECYEVLGLIHSMWKPVAGRFKDYISLPKANMYQSLHTTVITSLGERMEIQIRTWDMDRIAEEGIAAHWKYKEGYGSDKEMRDQYAWMRQLLEWQKSLTDPKEFLETVRLDLFSGEVYVFTPKGEVKALPKGATPVDFAYSIHSEVGNRCTGAKVNERIVPLSYQLKNGDIVHIITSKNHKPSKDWLNFVKTSTARTRIRQWIKKEERKESVAIGRDILEKELKKFNLSLSRQFKNEQILDLVQGFSLKSMDDLLANIGYGKISAKQVLNRLIPHVEIKGDKPEGLVQKIVHRIKRKKAEAGIKVKGMSDMLIRFGRCCHPLPGEPAIGFITRGRGVTIHTKDCRYIREVDPYRLVEVEWERSEDVSYLARLRITNVSKKGMLANISAIFAQSEANIVDADIHTTIDKKGISTFTIEVSDYNQLRDIISKIKKIKEVLKVERI
ncbi:MAG: bifunctional (p)ppGpp synthetase/guanosine-3',5'-bis(diphosphate) 3'-pyrophosphohydrolase [Deltaproteobacteria bacterium]|nr:MAG: bifunctional (p)ppGpp synthetase/guanosine-3',5'-bis(diphosphate) 3'-pyrophosphohydrolase [Deltaproteobacteria bacterium]